MLTNTLQIMCQAFGIEIRYTTGNRHFMRHAMRVECNQAELTHLNGMVDQLVGPESTRIRPETEGEAMLYGSSAGLVRSDALVALPEGEGLPLGVFAVGCRTANHFEDGQGTELIAFLAHVSRYAVGRWWTLKL